MPPGAKKNPKHSGSSTQFARFRTVTTCYSCLFRDNERPVQGDTADVSREDRTSDHSVT